MVGTAIEDDGFSPERTDELADADAILLIVNTPEDRVYAATACLDLLNQTYQTLA